MNPSVQIMENIAKVLGNPFTETLAITLLLTDVSNANIVKKNNIKIQIQLTIIALF